MSSGTPRPNADARVPVPHSTVAAGATNTPNPGPSAPESGQDDSGQLRAAFDCPACSPEDRPWCDHRPDALPLARALAVHFQGVAEPSREQMGWFLDDAGSLLKDAGPGPYAIRMLAEGWHSEHAFLLNNLVVTIGEGGKDCPAQPEVAAVLPEGHVLVPVSVDDDTVERVARAIFAQARARYDGREYIPSWDNDPEEDREEFRFVARAAVQALRDGPEQELKHHDECCPHCTARTGSCVRCGVRDAEDGEQLCGQCDSEVEAEALRDGSDQ